ncbi:hypothetical protein H4R18_005478 [Coemansia javaensis]|uniref:UspA domain-containing protein n=1 Tax=Coemansia javaensis TaxID=2761396 RepID=A0A9W8H1R4_9FUNG|nr:hypothetical protein H4R18_005478 [Coemansia javaensis]
MTEHVPLSLRRKIVIALDSQLLLSKTPAESDGEADMQGRFQAFKTVAWAKANIVRAHEDHVFLVTCVESSGPGIVDGPTLAMMWSSMVGDVDVRRDLRVEAGGALRRLAEALSGVGVSATAEVLNGAPAEAVPRFVHDHRGELLVVQAPARTAVASALWYSWADHCAHSAACPTVVVKESDLSDNVAVALDPPLATATADQS